MAADDQGKTPRAGLDAHVRFYGRQVWKRGGSVLVLGCAGGELALELCTRSERVVAVDPSAVLVRAVEERRAELGGHHERLHLLEADLGLLRLPDRFTVVLAPHNALGLAGSPQELDTLLETARHHLQAGGALAFDVLNRPDESESWGPAFIPHLHERQRAERHTIVWLQRRQLQQEDVDAALERCGFAVLERYGDFEGKPFNPTDALQVVVASLT